MALLSLCLGLCFLGCHAARRSAARASSEKMDPFDFSDQWDDSWGAPPGAPGRKGPPPRRVISVSDLHGDAKMARRILESLALMSPNGEWIGGDAVLVQTGDVVDRGDHSMEIFEMLFALQDAAPRSGGVVHLMMGNHELMNLMGNHGWMTKEDMVNFGGQREMLRQFQSGPIGQRLKEQPMLVRLGAEVGLSHPVVYVHAGLLERTAQLFAEEAKEASGPGWDKVTDPGDRLIKQMNQAMTMMMTGRIRSAGQYAPVLLRDEGPLWTRELSLGKDPCEELKRTLAMLNATRMIVGHTVQEENYKVNERCGGRLVLTDTAISMAFTGEPHPSAVEYKADGCAVARYWDAKGDGYYGGGGNGVKEELSCVGAL